MAKAIVTAKKIKRYPSTSDVAHNCAKLFFVRHEKRSEKNDTHPHANVPNIVINSGDNASSRTSLACYSFLKEIESMIMSLFL